MTDELQEAKTDQKSAVDLTHQSAIASTSVPLSSRENSQIGRTKTFVYKTKTNHLFYFFLVHSQ